VKNIDTKQSWCPLCRIKDWNELTFWATYDIEAKRHPFVPSLRVNPHVRSFSACWEVICDNSCSVCISIENLEMANTILPTKREKW